jgi:hypothetical protein
MLRVRGETREEYFAVLCARCNAPVKMEYMGWDPTVPQFKVTCPGCGQSNVLKVAHSTMQGLSPRPFVPVEERTSSRGNPDRREGPEGSSKLHRTSAPT